MRRRDFMVPDTAACAAVSALLAMGAGAVVHFLVKGAGFSLLLRITFVGMTASCIFLTLSHLLSRRSDERRQNSN